MILTTLRLPARLEAALTKHTVANLRAQRRAAPGAAPTVHDLVATQMDRSYATAHRVMREARHRLPSYTPRRVLDFGAGQSPMAWAAQASWPGAPLQVCAPSLTLPLPLPLTLTLTLTLPLTPTFQAEATAAAEGAGGAGVQSSWRDRAHELGAAADAVGRRRRRRWGRRR